MTDASPAPPSDPATTPPPGADPPHPSPAEAPTPTDGSLAASPEVAPGAPPVASPTPDEGPGLLDRLPGWTVPAILVGVPLLVAIVAWAVPNFYDQVIWKYYWGPIKADAENVARLTHDGVHAHSGYNVVNTLTWAALLGTCILGLAQMLRHFRTAMDARLIVAATSWVVVGSVAHVLEDADLFETPLQYLFITPPIYLLFGAFGVAAFLVGQWLKSVEAKRGLPTALRMLWLVHVVLVLLWTAFWLKPWDQITHYVNPLWVAGFAVVSFFVARHFILRTGTIDPTQLCLTLSLGTYLLVFAYVASFLRDPWLEPGDNAMPSSSLIAPALALACVALVYVLARKSPKTLLGIVIVGASLVAGAFAAAIYNVLVSRLGLPTPQVHGLAAAAVAVVIGALVASRWYASIKPRLADIVAQTSVAFALGINLLIVFAQMVDAFATSIGIDLAGYIEKHVLSAAVIGGMCEFSGATWVDIGPGHECVSDGTEWFAFGADHPTFLGFAPVKLLVSLLVIYAIDVYSKEDTKTHPTLIGLVKFAIIMVGLGPGVRDFTRLSLGV